MNIKGIPGKTTKNVPAIPARRNNKSRINIVIVMCKYYIDLVKKKKGSADPFF
ncbi:MAG: hypothetical protein WC080_02355 [Patescibacteria group bacterium]